MHVMAEIIPACTPDACQVNMRDSCIMRGLDLFPEVRNRENPGISSDPPDLKLSRDVALTLHRALRLRDLSKLYRDDWHQGPWNMNETSQESKMQEIIPSMSALVAPALCRETKSLFRNGSADDNTWMQTYLCDCMSRLDRRHVKAFAHRCAATSISDADHEVHHAEARRLFRKICESLEGFAPFEDVSADTVFGWWYTLHSLHNEATD